MPSIPEIFVPPPIFLGPTDRLAGFDRIWYMIDEDRQSWGKNGDDLDDLKTLSRVLRIPDKDQARGTMLGTWEIGDDYQMTPHPNAALKGDTPLVWTVDFNQNRIFYDRDGVHLFHEFRLPRTQCLKMRHFQPYIPKIAPRKTFRPPSAICSSTVAPEHTVPESLFNLVYRIASDYELNWRETGSTVEEYGLYQLGMGILSCFTLNFKSELISTSELKLSKGLTPLRARPAADNLLRWRAWPPSSVVPAVSLGRNRVVLLTEQMEDATTLIRKHFNDDLAHEGYRYLAEQETTYIVTSVVEIQCFKVTATSTQCTPLIPFFDSKHLPSETGARWLLNAIHGDDYPLTTRLQTLPTELQDMILDYAAEGEIDRAMYAGVLGLNILFDWEIQGLPLKKLQLEKWREVSLEYPEQQILFGDDYVGISYQPDVGQRVLSVEELWAGEEKRMSEAIIAACSLH